MCAFAKRINDGKDVRSVVDPSLMLNIQIIAEEFNGESLGRHLFLLATAVALLFIASNATESTNGSGAALESNTVTLSLSVGGLPCEDRRTSFFSIDA